MNTEERLRERLGTIEVPPSRVDLETLLPAVRRRVFRRRLARAAGGAALTAGVLLAVPTLIIKPAPRAAPEIRADRVPAGHVTASPAPSGATVCRATDLPVPAGMKQVGAAAVDPTGKYIVGNGSVGQNFRPVLWTAGKARALSLPATSVQLTDVNSAGVVVGLATESNRDWVFRYSGGTYTRLRLPSGSWNPYPEPVINAAGDVLINAEPLGNSGGKGSIVLLWKAGSNTAIKVPLPTGANGMDLADDGTIVGALYVNGSAVAAYSWDQQGHGHKLAAPNGQTAAAYAVRGEWATGGLWPSMTAGLWNLKTGTVTQLAKTGGPGNRVNASGWVVTDGSVVRADGPVKLAVPKGQTAGAADVSDTGLVVGQVANHGPRQWQC